MQGAIPGVSHCPTSKGLFQRSKELRNLSRLLGSISSFNCISWYYITWLTRCKAEWCLQFKLNSDYLSQNTDHIERSLFLASISYFVTTISWKQAPYICFPPPARGLVSSLSISLVAKWWTTFGDYFKSFRLSPMPFRYTPYISEPQRPQLKFRLLGAVVLWCSGSLFLAKVV